MQARHQLLYDYKQYYQGQYEYLQVLFKMLTASTNIWISAQFLLQQPYLVGIRR